MKINATTENSNTGVVKIFIDGYNDGYAVASIIISRLQSADGTENLFVDMLDDSGAHVAGALTVTDIHKLKDGYRETMVVKVPSETQKGVEYFVVFNYDTKTVVCSCPDFLINRLGTQTTCKHIGYALTRKYIRLPVDRLGNLWASK